MSWIRGEELRSGDNYALCRCDKSNKKPFCDDTHEENGFEGTEATDTGPISDLWTTFDGPKIVIQDDHSICMHSGFCGTRITNIWRMQANSDKSEMLAEITAMIHRCPSGTLAYILEPGGETIERDLPKEVAIIPNGPIWITGGIPVERSEGQPRKRETESHCDAVAGHRNCRCATVPIRRSGSRLRNIRAVRSNRAR